MIAGAPPVLPDQTTLSMLRQAFAESVPSTYPDDVDSASAPHKVPEPGLLSILADYLEDQGKGAWSRAVRWMARGHGPRCSRNVSFWWWFANGLKTYRAANCLPDWVSSFTFFYSYYESCVDAVTALLAAWEYAEHRDGRDYTR